MVSSMDRKCPKCADWHPKVAYEEETDRLRCMCNSTDTGCGHKWTEKTVDQLPARARPMSTIRINLIIAGVALFLAIVCGAFLLGS